MWHIHFIRNVDKKAAMDSDCHFTFRVDSLNECKQLLDYPVCSIIGVQQSRHFPGLENRGTSVSIKASIGDWQRDFCVHNIFHFLKRTG